MLATDHEKALTELYSQQLTLYTNLHDKTESLSQLSLTGKEADQTMMEIGKAMDAISRIDQAVQPIRSDWNASGRSPGKQLASVLASLEKVICGVMEHIALAESTAASAKSKLEPKLAQEIRMKKMVSAYAAAQSRE